MADGSGASAFWMGKRVLVTGHTGFKGSWLSLWLSELGAKVHGYALPPDTTPSLHEMLNRELYVSSTMADIRDGERLRKTVREIQPEIVFHMAAQPLVHMGYETPVDTFSTNVMGVVHLLESLRDVQCLRAVVNVTTDKVYENREWSWGYREADRLGGSDPYSASKACAELVTAAYRKSFFADSDAPGIATARAGNVIGGGDWASNRLLPDCLSALLTNQCIVLRNPKSVRPWQHVLEPLHGYLILAEHLYANPAEYGGAWNFGPLQARTVQEVAVILCEQWGESASQIVTESSQSFIEAYELVLDSTKARRLLGWAPRWTLDTTLEKIVEWTKAYRDHRDMRSICLSQIHDYCGTGAVGCFN
ncbi:MAG: CDP-glucose 4,6-dehydratase [Bacilli bacterium]